MDASEFESTGYMALKRKMLQLTASHPELLGLEKEISAAAGKVRAFAVRRTLYNLFFVSFKVPHLLLLLSLLLLLHLLLPPSDTARPHLYLQREDGALRGRQR